MNTYELEREENRKKIAKKIIKKFKPVAKGTKYEDYLDQIITFKAQSSDKLKNLELFDQVTSGYGYVTYIIDAVLDQITEADILEILETLIEDVRIDSLEEFLKLSSLKDKFLENKDLVLQERSDLAYTTLKYSESFSVTKKILKENIEAIIGKYGYQSLKDLNKEVKKILDYKLFFDNFDLYLKKGKYADILKQLAVSKIPVRGKWKTDKSPLEGFQDLFLIENEEEFLESLNNRLSSFAIGGKETLYYLIEDKEEIKSLISNNPTVIYSFTVAKETAKNYYLNREKLIYAKEEDNKYVSDFLFYFKQILLSKEYDAVLNVGEKLVIVENEYGCQIIKEEDYNQFKYITDQNSKLSTCSKKDLENISNYFTQVLSNKISNDFDSLNAEREAKIKKLEEQYYSIPMPTHEDLLKVCVNMNLNPYGTDIPNYESRVFASNFEKLNSILNLEKREKIGSTLRELRIQRKNSNDTLEEAKEFGNINVSLTEKQKVAAGIIFDKYYSEESKTIEHDFYFDYKRNCRSSEKKDYAKEIIVRRKKEILKTTTCAKSDFDFS